MASPPRPAEREEERRLNLRTLAVASVASATAALVVSQLWIAGTWIAAAMTPVIVALVSELLHRPTERIARGFTADRAALQAAPPRDRPRPAGEPPVRFYRAGEAAPQAPRPRTPPGRRRRIAWAVVATTAALALAIAVFAITVPELVAGGSVSKRDGGSTFFGHAKKRKSEPTETTTTPTQPTTPQTETTPPPTTPETTPQTTPPTQSTPQPLTTPTGPAPAPQQ